MSFSKQYIVSLGIFNSSGLYLAELYGFGVYNMNTDILHVIFENNLSKFESDGIWLK